MRAHDLVLLEVVAAIGLADGMNLRRLSGDPFHVDEDQRPRFQLWLVAPMALGVVIVLIIAYIGLCYRRKVQRRRHIRELLVESPRTLRLDFVAHDLQNHYAATPGTFLPLSPSRSTLDVGQLLDPAEESSRLLLTLLESNELANKWAVFG